MVSDAEYPFAQACFTGSEGANIVMRQRAIARDLRLIEYGLFKSKERRAIKLRVVCNTEEDILLLSMTYPPELREDKGEFEAGKANSIPRLIGGPTFKARCTITQTGVTARVAREIAEYMSGCSTGRSPITLAPHSANGLDEST